MMRVKKEIIQEGTEEEEEKVGCIQEWVKMGEERWRVIGVNVNGDMGKNLEKIKNSMKRKNEKQSED